MFVCWCVSVLVCLFVCFCCCCCCRRGCGFYRYCLCQLAGTIPVKPTFFGGVRCAFEMPCPKICKYVFFSRYHDNPSTNFQVHLMCFVTNYSNNLHVGSGCYVANFSINFQVRSGCYVANFSINFQVRSGFLDAMLPTLQTTSKYLLDAMLLKSYVPNSLSSQSRDSLLYCGSWQWRYISLHANLHKKTVENLNRIF